DRERVIGHVGVTNVSFTDEDGEPFVWDEDSPSAGQPYAIANFNIVNKYGRDKALELFKEGEYQESANQKLSARVTPELGLQLRESMYASLDMKERMVNSIPGDDTSEKVPALMINRVVPEVISAGKSAYDDEVFASVEEKEEEPELNT